jgi:hypothetical protein
VEAGTGHKLVINSAGQDNHFTDPITNMKLTTKGYAEMSGLIAPDIAVLEGGYAIQGALPFTNLAIILSMAQLDWSRVEEPMPPGGPPKTRPEVLDLVKRMADFIHGMRKSQMVPLVTGSVLKNGFWERRREIFYDSHPADPKVNPNWPSMITERRLEFLKDCPNCPGALVIVSSSNVAKEKTFVALPHEPCEACQKLSATVQATGAWKP